MIGHEDGFDVLNAQGSRIGAAVPHPRMPGMWLAMWKPRDWRDSGMKRYKTRKGAIARVQKENEQVAK